MRPFTSTALLTVCGALLTFSTTATAAVTSAMTMQYESAFDTAVNNYRNRMAARGASVGAKDVTIFWSEVADPGVCIGGTCGEDNINDNLDAREAMLLATHGAISTENESCTDYQGLAWEGLLTTTSGNPRGEQTDRMLSTEMRLGNHRLNFLELYACQSNNFHFAGNWLTRFSGLHQLHGYQGTFRIGHSLTAGRIDDFVDDAFDGAAAWAWVENQTGKTYDKSDSCGTSLTVGNSLSDAASRQDTETYKSNLSDPAPNAGWYLWKCPCNPPGTSCDFSVLGLC